MTTSYPSAASTVRSLLGTTGSPELVLQRRYRAAPGEVLAACTDLERLSQWFGQVGGGPAAVGDTFTARVRGVEDTSVTGEVLACAADGLSIAWSPSQERESVVSLRVAAAGEGESELTLLHVLSEPGRVAASGAGWEQHLASLARHLEGEGADAPAPDAAAAWETMAARPLEIHWHIPADLDRVWTALATTEGLEPWWWGHFPFVTIDADAAPGASYRITAPSAGIELEGTYLIVARPRRLSSTWRWSEAGITSRDEAVDIALDPGDGGTVITLRHTGPWADDQSVEDCSRAWQATLAALESALLP